MSCSDEPRGNKNGESERSGTRIEIIEGKMRSMGKKGQRMNTVIFEEESKEYLMK